MTNVLSTLASHTVLIVVELALLAAVLMTPYIRIRKWYRDRRSRGTLTAEVTRGEKSWGKFPIAFVIVFQIASAVVASHELVGPLQGAIHLLNGAIVFRLCFFDPWFRNRAVRILGASEQMRERF